MSTSSQQPRGPPLIQYDPHNFDVYAVNEYGLFGFSASLRASNKVSVSFQVAFNHQVTWMAVLDTIQEEPIYPEDRAVLACTLFNP
jgi:hypothetical protein